MGEAARKRKYLEQVGLHEMPAEHKRIAEAIAGTHITTWGGACFLYNIMAKTILDEQGIDTMLVRGGLVYRVGPGELDGVFFCDANNQASGPMQHYWMETEDGLIIDFSSSDWHALQDRDPAAEMMPAITWEIEPPAYIWDKRENVVGSSQGYLPRVGRAFYNRSEVIGELDRWPGYEESRGMISPALPGIRARLNGE